MSNHPGSKRECSSASASVSIVVGGDLCPTASDERCFKSGSSSDLLQDYAQLWARADFRILNLECPLTRQEQRILKNGPHVKASPECVNWLRRAQVNAICLANNHIRDYGSAGVRETLEVCRSAGLPTVGAGPSLEQARLPLCINIKGLRLSIIAMAEHEFNLAAAGTPGANPIDYRNFSLVKETRENTDFLLVLIHGGTEMLQFPRPGLVELSRFLVEQGANAVIVQHTHCVGCYEVYRQCPIVYGQGNFIFASGAESFVTTNDPNWFSGMLVELRIAANRPCEFQFHPFQQSFGFCGIRGLPGEARKEFLDGLEKRSEILRNPAEMIRIWAQFCGDRRTDVLARSLGISGLAMSVDARVPFSRFLNAISDRALRHNMVACESNRELLEHCLQRNGVQELNQPESSES